MRYLILFLCLAVSAFADKLKLNNGTTVEGNIIAETDTEYTVERSLSGGSIKTKDTIRKSDVAEVIRSTAEEKTAAVMKEAYEASKRYQLDPNNSYAKDYYDQVLSGVFRKFLADYPDSPFASELNERIAAWEAERDMAAAGRVKLRGRWLDAGHANQLREQEGAQQVIARAQAYAGQGRFQEAIQLIQQLRTAKDSAIAEEASRQEQRLHQAWQNHLDSRLRSIATEIQGWETRRQNASATGARARENLKEWKRTADTGRVGYKGFLAQHEDAIQHAEVEEKTCNVQLTQLRNESAAMQQKLNELQSHMEVRGMATLRQPPPPEPDTATKLTTWAKEYWLYGLIGLVVLWLILRKTG